MSDLCIACGKVVGRRQHAKVEIPVAIGSIVFVRQVHCNTNFKYLAILRLIFIYLFIQMLRPIYSRKHAFTKN